MRRQKIQNRPIAASIVLAMSVVLAGCQSYSGVDAARQAAITAATSDAERMAMIQQAVDAPTRSATNRSRDAYRHPAETLSFFGFSTHKPKIVEIWPGGGWYSEILAPLAQNTDGHLTVLLPAADSYQTRWTNFVAGNTALYGTITKGPNFPGDDAAFAPLQADVVLTFRNVHNWRFGGTDNAARAFRNMYAMLKPGGVLGVVEHRLPENMDSKLEEKSGYMKESTVIALAEAAGFRLDARSDINANPRDTHDYPDGVWTLPPTLKLGDKDREKYLAIGESDRMTLRFVKP